MAQFVIERLVQAPKDVVWVVVSDVVGYAEIAPNLSKAVIESGEGVGMQRRCWDTRGGTWAEECVLWQEGEAYSFVVDTSDYPYPLSQMQGTWSVAQRPSGTLIRMQFDYQMKYGTIATWLANAALKRSFARICEELLDNWEAVIIGRMKTAVPV